MHIHTSMQGVVFEAFLTIFSWMPSAVPGAMRLLFKYGDPIRPTNRIDVSHRVFNIPNYFPNHNEAELVVGIEDCAPAIKELKVFVEEEHIPLNYITEVCVLWHLL